MEMFRVEMEVGLSGATLDDVISTAVEGGIGYWADFIRVRDDGSFAVQDGDGGSFRLNRLVIRKGLERLAASYPHRFMEVVDGTYDAEVADMAVQLAFFEDVIYG